VSEFTGERVIPGQVNDDLWAEHLARYAFAARFAAGKRVLDAGCGTGYGALELGRDAAAVTGIDVAWDAVDYAVRGGSGRSGQVAYCQASVEAMPFAAASFDLITAFEVIEHLADWRALAREAKRVLRPAGTFLVSTPNRSYYAESRGAEGPNPYHVHEFEYEEFQAALHEFFPHVEILLQNRVEGFAFQGLGDGGSGIGETHDSGRGTEAHFFIGVCGVSALPELQAFVYVPRAANLLRERERHIRKLEQELDQVKLWLDGQIGEHAKLQSLHQDLTAHLEERNRWALELQENWKAAQNRIVQLQDELKAHESSSAEMAAGYERQVAGLQQENREKTEWALQTEARLMADLAARGEQHAATVRLLDQAEATVIERTEWAQRLDQELAFAKAQLDAIRRSRWLKLGRIFGVGPKL
jgi:SAM-dependent methyltransferase